MQNEAGRGDGRGASIFFEGKKAEAEKALCKQDKNLHSRPSFKSRQKGKRRKNVTDISPGGYILRQKIISRKLKLAARESNRTIYMTGVSQNVSKWRIKS
jgi:hypothetical protein